MRSSASSLALGPVVNTTVLRTRKSKALDLRKGQSALIAKRLLAWNSGRARDFSWRGTRDPYKVLVAEVMLQKTDAEKVNRIYGSFIEKYPSARALSSAGLKELRRDINSLGLHSRAERLKRSAALIVEKYGGALPDSREELLSLPGVGEYISSAILCFAFGKAVPLLDVNVARVYARLFNLKIKGKSYYKDKKLINLVLESMPKKRAREFNIALLDFASAMCKSRDPLCENCRLRDLCLFARNALRA